MSSRLELYLILTISLLLHTSYAQHNYIIDVQQFGLEEGLSHRNILDVFKDSHGFLWLSNDYGLQRYDGYEFKTFPLLGQKGKFKVIRDIGETSDGWLHLHVTEAITDRRTSIFLHPLTGESITVEEKWGKELAGQLDEVLNNRVKYTFTQNPKKDKGLKELYFSDGKEIIIFSVDKGIRKMKLPDSPLLTRERTNWRLYLKLIDSDGNYWLRKDVPHQILKFNPAQNTLELIGTSNYKRRITEWNGEVYLFDEPSQENDQITFSKYNPSGEIEKLFEIPKGLEIHQLVDDRLWCIGASGWKIFDLSGTLLFELKKEDYGVELCSDYLNYKTIISDESGKVYLNTQFGLNIIEVKESPFKQYFSKTDGNSLPIRNAARGIHVHKDTILVNFEFGGLVLMNKNEDKNYEIISTTSKRDTSEGYSGNVILKDGKGYYRINHDSRFLQSKWSSDLTREEKVNDKNIDLKSYEVSWAIWEDRNNCIWSGYNKKLKRICEGDSSQENFFLQEIGIEFQELNIYHFFEEEKGWVWLCSEKGLFQFDIEKEKVIRYYHTEGEGEYYLPANDIFHMHIDEDGHKWLGTRQGLIFWNTTNNEKRLLNRNDGFSNEVIYAVYEDEYNRLWLSSDYGIMSLDKETFNVQAYLPKDGLTQEEFNRISHFKAEDGAIYFGGLNGITAFHPDDFIDRNKEYSKVLLSECIIFDGEEDKEIDVTKNIIETRNLTFAPSDRYFKLKFTLPTFNDTHKTLYAWKIDGVFDNWNYQKENTLQFGGLPYGNHILDIKGQGTGGGWSPNELQIKIQVLKPFYLQTWFMILSAITILGSIFLFFKSRTKRLVATQKLLEKEVTKATAQIKEDKKLIEIQAEELKKLDKVKSRFFANVSHELRTPLTLILGPINAVMKSGNLNTRNLGMMKKANRSGRELLKLVGSILDLSKMDSGKIELYEQAEFLYPLMDRMVLSFESHAQSNGIDFIFDYQAGKDLQVELDRNKMEVILNNLLSNAVKFTPSGGTISTTVRDNGETIQIKIQDTGRGIHPKDQLHVFDRFYQSQLVDAPTEGGTGIGLALTNEFVKMMGGEIRLESEFGQGSVFIVEIPKKETDILVMSENRPDYTYTKEKNNLVISKPTETIGTRKNLPTILVTEDNFSLREYIVTILEPYYNVVTAENGLRALDILQSNNNIQLIMSDIMMPEMDGIQLLEILKSKKYFYQIPVIMLTARADIKDKLKALRIGVDDYLLKPFDEEELLARIENLLHNYQERITFLAEEKSDRKAPDTPSVFKEDSEWLGNIERYLNKHISDSSYSITKLSHDMALSERQLRRRLKALTGLTPTQYFQEIRLGQARKYLEQKTYKTVAQTAFAVGFQTPRSFSRSFSQKYGKLPSSYISN